MSTSFFRKIRSRIASNIPLNERMVIHMGKLAVICENPDVQAAFEKAVSHVQETNTFGEPNEWKNANIKDLQIYFQAWFTDLQMPEGGLGFILPFTWFYLNNPYAYFFLNKLRSKTFPNKDYSKEIFQWTVKFIMIRGEFMDSCESTLHVKKWIEHPDTRMNDFIVPKDGFKSFNQFFGRELNMKNDPRPISCPGDDSIVVAPADSVINFILADLTLYKKMDVKGRQISVLELLNRSKYAKQFVGGTAVSCVLLPNVYHHFHAPVTGKVVEGGDIPGIYNGIVDGQNWFNNGENIGAGDTDFSIFEDFHRAYFIIETREYGYVAVLPVGLNTISRIKPSLIGRRSCYVSPGERPVHVEKGDELGYFQYGGSLNILLFQRGKFGAVSLLMGNRLGKLSR